MGTVPPGYAANYDQQGNVTSLTPIPGGPAATKSAEKEEKDQTLKFFDDNVKGIKKETTKSSPSKSNGLGKNTERQVAAGFKRPNFKKNPSGGYTRKYTGR